MRSERRHELQQNELADWLTDGIETVKPYVNVILGLTILILIVVVGGTWWVQQSSAESAEAWDSYYLALTSGKAAELSAVAKDYPDAKAARWAEVVAADMYLGSGCNQLFSNRADANIELDKAAELFLQVINKSVLLDRATFGLAQTREAMGELDEAKTLYEKVTQSWPNSPFAEISARRLKALEQPSTLAFYDRFGKFDPKPAFADQPGIPGAGPLFDDSSLLGPSPSNDPGSFPNLDLEILKSDEPATLKETAPSKEPVEKPKEEDAKKSDTAKPADKKPAEKK